MGGDHHHVYHDNHNHHDNYHNNDNDYRDNNYNNKNKYYPFKMDEFDDIARNIESSYREKIAEMQMQRFQKENEEKLKAECEERTLTVMKAAEGLLELSNPDRFSKKKNAVPNKVRRSARFANVPSWTRGSRYLTMEEEATVGTH
mgnify:CR=1 FL=1